MFAKAREFTCFEWSGLTRPFEVGDRAAWENLAEVEQYDVSASDGAFFRCALTPLEGTDLRPAIFNLVRENGWELRELTRSRHSLEDVYVQVTKPNQEERE